MIDLDRYSRKMKDHEDFEKFIQHIYKTSLKGRF